MKLAHHLATISFVVFLTRCATYDAVTASSAAKGSASEAFACAAATLNSLGYTVMDANKEAGFIKAQKQRGSGHAFLTGHADSDRITVSIFEDPSTRVQTMRVSGDTIAAQEIGWQAGSVVSQQTTADVKGQVQKLIAACAK